MMKKKKITIKDVAKHAGVGVGTVSRAINKAPGISQETKRKVFQSIRELGYTPDRIAQSMRSQKYKNIAFFVDLSNIAFAQIAKGIHDELGDLGYILSLCDVGTTGVSEKVGSFLEGRKFDGVILAAPDEDDKELQELVTTLGIPVVTLDRDIPGIPAGIMTDYYSSVKKATHYLLSMGHRGIALIKAGRNIRPARTSLEAFLSVYEERGIPASEAIIKEGEFSNEFGRRAMLELLPLIREGRVTAILCLNNQVFHGILAVMRENGLEYPRDVSLITMEDYELTQLLNPAVTVIRRPLLEMGRSVSHVLVKYIEQPELYGKLPPVIIPTEFVIRDSCRENTARHGR